MKSLRNKMKNQGGFTLIEMLIVVAIIAILVAVSIPVVNNALDKTRRATDAANERAAKAAVMVAYLTEASIEDGAENAKFLAGDVYAYDAVRGILTKVDGNLTAYGQCTDHKERNVIVVKYDATVSGVSMAWVKIDDAKTAIAGKNFAADDTLHDASVE